MNILLIEPYFTGSHKQWCEGWRDASQHNIELLTMSGHYWKWRMHGGAITLARQFNEQGKRYDAIVVSDMLDLTTFQSLTRKLTADTPFLIYFHENQITYPWSPTDRDIAQKRDHHYGFINIASALAADRVLFNSQFHRGSFLEALPKFLKGFPDHNELNVVQQIEEKADVLYIGLPLKKLSTVNPSSKEKPNRAVLLWNHRWEYDKNPDDFFSALYTLSERGIDFKLIVLGERFDKSPSIFDEAKEKLSQHILHFGYADSFEEYVQWMQLADLQPVTSKQDFFGISVVEAMYMNVKPLLPFRLAFPEHIPESLHTSFFYDNQEEFISKLQRRIMDVRVLRKQNTRQFVERYDWSEMILEYDNYLTSIV